MALNDHTLNNDNYLHKAFDPEQRQQLIRAARVRRTIYLFICFIGVACLMLAGWMRLPVISALSLLMSALSLVVVSKYDTQRHFLQVIEKREKEKEDTQREEFLER